MCDGLQMLHFYTLQTSLYVASFPGSCAWAEPGNEASLYDACI